MTRRPFVLVVLEDPGAANAVGPVLERLRRDDRVDVAVHAFSGAFEQLGVDGAPASAQPPDEAIDRLLDRVDLLVTGTSGYRVEEKRFRRRATALGIPTLGVLDFWNGYVERFSDVRGDLQALPDMLAVMDDQARHAVLAVGVPPERVVVTGHPGHDHLHQLRGEPRTAVARGETAQVTFLSQPWRALTGSDPDHHLHPGYDEAEVLTATVVALDELAGTAGIRIDLLVRPHPREDRSDIRPPSAEHVDVTVDDHAPLLDVLTTAHLVVGMSAAPLVDACILGIPTISFQPDMRGDDALPTNTGGHSVLVTSSKELAAEASALLLDAGARHRQHQQAASLAHAGDATGRVAELVYGLVRRP